MWRADPTFGPPSNTVPPPPDTSPNPHRGDPGSVARTDAERGPRPHTDLVSPDDIALVHRTWRSALADMDQVHQAVAARLTGSASFRAERARWVLRAVSLLAPLLDRPTTFEPVAAELIANRYPVTLDELAVERDALLGALAEQVGGLTGSELRAWELAIGLFSEIVAAIGLDPFGCAPLPVASVGGGRP